MLLAARKSLSWVAPQDLQVQVLSDNFKSLLITPQVQVLLDGANCPIRRMFLPYQSAIGCDLGIKDFLITSEGEVFENPKYLRKAQSKLKYVQRKYSKNKGKRAKKKLAKLHEKVANKRKDFLHKVSTQLIRENQTIALETKNILISLYS